MSESLDRSIEEVGSPEHVFYLTLFTLIIHQQQSYCATVGLAGSVRESCLERVYRQCRQETQRSW